MMHFKIFGISVAVILSLTLFFVGSKLVQNVEADEYVVIQSPIAGNLDWYLKPGLEPQWFGEPTHYKQRAKYDFNEKGYEVRFNDGGHGTIFGSIQYELPANEEKLNALHRKYKTMDRVQTDLVETATNASLYLVGTLMSSKESYSEKRNDLIHYVTDQVQNGIYRTRQKTDWIKDPITGETKQVTSAEIILGADGIPLRQEISPLLAYGIRVFNFTVNKLPYDPIVEKQIQQQQQITMAVQTSVAEAKQAEQRALTVEQQGKANAAAAKWEQETIKAQATTKADQDKLVAITVAEQNKAVAETAAAQRLNVAKLDRDAAEQTKAQDILLGEGESARRKLVLAADGALSQKLATYEKVTATWAAALRGSELVPRVVMGGNGSSQASPALDLVGLLTVKAAKDLALDMGMPAQPKVMLGN